MSVHQSLKKKRNEQWLFIIFLLIFKTENILPILHWFNVYLCDSLKSMLIKPMISCLYLSYGWLNVCKLWAEN